MGESEYATRGTTVATAAGIVTGIGADSKRVGLIVSITVGVTVIVLHAKGAPDVDHRIALTTESPAYLTYKDFGPLLSYGWDVEAAGVGSFVTFVELLYQGG